MDNIFKILIGLIIVGCLAGIAIVIHHDIKYVCLRGHYETQYRWDPNLKVMMPYENWVCEEEMLREDYEKLKK